MNNQFNSPTLTYNENRSAVQQAFAHPVTLLAGIFLLALTGYNFYDVLVAGTFDKSFIRTLFTLAIQFLAIAAYLRLFFNARKPDASSPSGSLGMLKTYGVLNIISSSLLILVSVILCFVGIPMVMTLHSNTQTFIEGMDRYTANLPEYQAIFDSIKEFIVNNANSLMLVSVIAIILFLIYSICRVIWASTLVSFSNAASKTYSTIYVHKVSKLNLVVTVINVLIEITFMGMLYWFLHLLLPNNNDIVLESIATFCIPLVLNIGYEISNAVMFLTYNKTVSNINPNAAVTSNNANSTYGSYNSTDTYSAPNSDTNHSYPTYGTPNPELGTPNNDLNNPYPNYNNTSNTPPTVNPQPTVPPIAPVPFAAPTTAQNPQSFQTPAPTMTQGFVQPVQPTQPSVQPSIQPPTVSNPAPTTTYPTTTYPTQPQPSTPPVQTSEPIAPAPVPQEITCPLCGKSNHPDSMFCKECGNPLK